MFNAGSTSQSVQNSEEGSSGMVPASQSSSSTDDPLTFGLMDITSLEPGRPGLSCKDVCKKYIYI